jgi:hypothetical protein
VKLAAAVLTVLDCPVLLNAGDCYRGTSPKQVAMKSFLLLLCALCLCLDLHAAAEEPMPEGPAMSPILESTPHVTVAPPEMTNVAEAGNDSSYFG